jgi:N-acetylneuraminic acid mutarotase
MPKKQKHFDKLPEVIISNIIKNLDITNLVNIFLISKLFLNLTEEISKKILNEIHREHFSYLSSPNKKETKYYTYNLYNLMKDNNFGKSNILLVGGFSNDNSTTDEINIIKITKNKLTSTNLWKPMIKKRFGNVTLYKQGELFIAGGDQTCINHKTWNMTLERYNIITQKSKSIDLPLKFLRYFSMTELNNKIYIIGGFYFESIYSNLVSNRVFYFDILNTFKWKELDAHTVIARQESTAITYQNKIWLAGGRDINGSNKYSSVEVYDSITNKWEINSHLSKEAFRSIKLLIIKDQLFAAGYDHDRSNKIWIDRYNNTDKTWSLISEINIGYQLHCMIVNNNSDIYFFKKSNDLNKPSYLLFNSDKQIWRAETCDENIISKNYLYGDAITIISSNDLERTYNKCIQDN